MVDVSPQSVFVERLKSALSSSFEAILAEITQVFLESFTPGSTHCKRCKDVRNRENHEGVWSDADGARPLMLPNVPEPPRETVKNDQQFHSDDDDDDDDDETSQASLRLLSDTEIQKVPELVAIFTPVKEEDLLEDPSPEHLGASGFPDALTSTECEETTLSSGSALQLKDQCDDEDLEVQILTDSSGSEPDASPEACLASVDVPDCSVQLQRIKVLQKLVDGFPRFHACSYCSRFFTSRKNHRRHTRFHTGERPYGCTLCSRTFVLRKTLRLHTDWHGRRPHGCSQCHMCFRSRKKLRVHWSVHDGESPFVCSRCGIYCKSLKRLSRHLIQKHLENRS